MNKNEMINAILFLTKKVADLEARVAELESKEMDSDYVEYCRMMGFQIGSKAQ